MSLPKPSEWPVEDPVGDAAADLLRERATATPDATAVVDADTGERRTYREFDDRASRRAERLARLLDADGGRVGLALDAGVAFAEVYFAVERLAGAVVPLNLDLPVETLRRQAAGADVDCLVCGAETERLAARLAPEGAPVASVDAPERDEVASLGGRPDAESPARADAEVPTRAEPPAREYSLDADRVVLFTSGTTGDPKGVRLTRRNLVASAVGSAYRLGVEPGDRWLAPLPMYHMGGLAPLVRSTLYGTTTVVQRSFDADSTAAALETDGVTGVSLVPTMLVRLLDAGWTPPDSLRFALLGGAPASAELLERALDRNVPVCPTYGATETASQVATATPDDVREHPGTVGRPLRGTDVSILDADGNSVEADERGATGERGEIVVSGPTVAPGYLDDEQTAAAFDSRGFHTGDVGYRDDAGRLRVVGRLDDRIVTGGENVHPADVVEALTDLPAVADAAVVGLPDPEWGQRVAALVVPDGQAPPPTGEEVRAALRGRVADYAVPKTVAFADELPRTASGTVDREAVRDRLADAADED